MTHKKFSYIRTAFWIILTPIAYFTGWLNIVAFVSILSLWALVESSYAAARADDNAKLIEQLRELLREELSKHN